MKASKRHRVLGILAIVFASLGVLSSVLRFADVEGGLAVLAIGACLVFLVHVVSGLQLLRGRPNAHRWVVGYAVLAIAIRIVDVAVVVTAPAPSHHSSEGIVVAHMVDSAGSAFASLASLAVSLLAMGWTITYLALALSGRSRRGASPASDAPVEVGHFAGA